MFFYMFLKVIYIYSFFKGKQLEIGSVFPANSVLRRSPYHWGTVIELRKLRVAIDKTKSSWYYDRKSVGQSISVPGTHLRPTTNFSPLTTGRVCSFQLLLVIASRVLLRFESHGIHEHISLSLFLRLPQHGGPGSCIYFLQEQGSPVIPLGIVFY
jgi:hypothetical protein